MVLIPNNASFLFVLLPTYRRSATILLKSCQNSTWWTPLLWNPFSKQSMECPSLLTWKNTVWSRHQICCCRKINLFRKLPPLWDIKAKVNLHRLSEIYFRYYLLHIRNCIVINNFNAKLHPQYPWVQFCIRSLRFSLPLIVKAQVTYCGYKFPPDFPTYITGTFFWYNTFRIGFTNVAFPE